jgi:hypothetical protein
MLNRSSVSNVNLNVGMPPVVVDLYKQLAELKQQVSRQSSVPRTKIKGLIPNIRRLLGRHNKTWDGDQLFGHKNNKDVMSLVANWYNDHGVHDRAFDMKDVRGACRTMHKSDRRYATADKAQQKIREDKARAQARQTTWANRLLRGWYLVEGKEADTDARTRAAQVSACDV